MPDHTAEPSRTINNNMLIFGFHLFMAVNYTKNSHSVCQKLLIIVQKGFTEYGMSVSKEANQNMETSFKIKILYH